VYRTRSVATLGALARGHKGATHARNRWATNRGPAIAQLARVGDVPSGLGDMSRRVGAMATGLDRLSGGRASTTKASWRDVEVSMRPVETSRRRESGVPGAWSTRPASVLNAASPHAHSSVPFAERSTPRAWASCSHGERIALPPSATWHVCEATCPAGELTLPSVTHDSSRCRTQRVVGANALDRRDRPAYSPARRLGVTRRGACTSPSGHARALSRSFDEGPSSWRERRERRSSSATHRSACPRQPPPAPSASNHLVDRTCLGGERITLRPRIDRTRCVAHHTRMIDSPSTTRRPFPPTLIALPPTGGKMRTPAARITPRIVTHQ
jgi:hypothetical protein